jgi:dihydropteroate synthase
MPALKQRQSLRIRDKELIFGSRTFIMGIVNVTPDSFSGDGILEVDGAVSLALKQVSEGADIVDIGGQSTRPGHVRIDEETEMQRVLPVIANLRRQSDVLISVDTYSAAVAEHALKAGADIVNSIWGLNHQLADVIKQKRPPIVIMHNKSEPIYPDGVVKEVVDVLKKDAEMAMAAGLAREEIILDPGIGFGKTADQNLEVMKFLQKIVALGFPTLIGTSRKSTIGKLTGRAVEERAFGTAASVALSVAAGVDIMRVHDVRAMTDAVRVSDAIVRGWRPGNWEAAGC